MRQAVAGLAAVLIAAPFGATAATHCPAPAQRLVYSVNWGGEPVGTYEIDFAPDGAGTTVRTTIDATAKLLFVTVTRLIHESVGTWADGRLLRYAGRTVDNGAETTIAVEPAAGGLAVVRNGRRRAVPADLLPESIWCESLIAGRSGKALFLDMLKGRLYDVEVRYAGKAEITIAGRRLPVRHYEISGGTEREVWYDDSGIAVQARMPAKFGPSIYLRRE